MLREALTDDLTLADGPIGAWKHAAAHFDPEFAANDVHVLFVVKSPGAWAHLNLPTSISQAKPPPWFATLLHDFAMDLCSTRTNAQRGR